MRPRAAPLLLASALAAASTTAYAQRAEYATAEELPGDGLSHLAELAMMSEYSHVAESDRVDLEHVGAFALGSRYYLGRTFAYCLGNDGAIGGSDAGFAYRYALYPVGVGVRFGTASVISICGGARVDAIGSQVPFAVSVPAELSAVTSLGSVRPRLWFRPAWVAHGDERQGGIASELADELEAGISVRVGRQHRYWSQTTAGGGPMLGVGWRGFMDTYALSVTLGLSFAGER